MRRTSRCSLFFFVFFYSYTIMRYLVFPYIYDTYSYMGTLVILLLMLFVIVTVGILPDYFIKADFYSKLQTSWFRYVVYLLIMFRITFTITATSIFIKEFFYSEGNLFLIIALAIITLLIFSSSSNISAIEISIIPGVVSILLYLYSFTSIIPIDFRLETETFDFKSIVILLMVICDYIYLLIMDKSTIEISKPGLIVPIVFSYVVLLVEYCILIYSSGDLMFKGYPYSGVVSLELARASKLYGSFEYIYAIMISMSSMIKCIYLYTFIKLKENRWYIMISTLIFAICILMVYLYYRYRAIFDSLIYYEVMMGVVVFIYLVWSWFNDRKAKGK